MRFCLLFLSLGVGLFAQIAVEGTICDSVTGAPVAGAYFTGWQNTAGDPMPVSDAAGHFRVDVPENQVHSNQVNLTVVRSGYLDHWENVTVKAGSEVKIPLTPQAVLSGRVVDEHGLPVRGARIAVLQHQTVDGRIQLQLWRGYIDTDELGEYYIGGLPAGRYYLAVAPGKLAEWDPRYLPRYYPDAVDPERAEPLDLQAGEERGGRDFRFVREEGITISGHLVYPDRTAKDTTVSLYLQSKAHRGISIPVSQPRRDTFLIAHVPPGNYTLRNWTYPFHPRIGLPIADVDLQVGRSDLHDLALEVRTIEEQDISGAVTFQGRTRPGPMTVSLRRELGDMVSVVSNSDGSFVVKGLLPGRYYLDVRSANTPGVAQTDGDVVGAQLGGHDVLWKAFDIGALPPGPLNLTVAAPLAKLTGKLLDATGQPVAGALIDFLSREGKIRTVVLTEADGTFAASVRTSGEHHIFVALNRDQSRFFSDPDYLDAHGRDFPTVAVAEGANPPLLLRLPPK